MTTRRSALLLGIVALVVAVAVGAVCRYVVAPAVVPTPVPYQPTVVVLPTAELRPQPSATPTAYAPFLTDPVVRTPLPTLTATPVPTMTPVPSVVPSVVPERSPIQKG